MSQAVPLAIRTLHVLAMVVVLGGTAACWYGFRTDSFGDPAVARRDEWVFWAALGVLVVTGIGNLGSLGVVGLLAGILNIAASRLAGYTLPSNARP